MSQKEEQKSNGVVVETLPNAMFRVQIDGEESPMIAYLSGRMRRFKIKVLIGDKVEVLLDPYGGKGRITKRF